MGKNKGKRASIFYQVVIILSIHLISGCRITASIPAFQAGDGGSTPLSRSNGMNLTNSAQKRHRILLQCFNISGFCQRIMAAMALVVLWFIPLRATHCIIHTNCGLSGKILSAPLPRFYSRPITCRNWESWQNGITVRQARDCLNSVP